TQVA
ncbi:hypothetical protein EC950183_3486, partial [Escherichia coli 95.0183]